MTAKAYLSRGVSPTKDDVKKAVAGQDKGLFPGAFCKIIEDPAGDTAFCCAIHADGAGTKSSLAYMMAQETGDLGWFAGVAQDSLVMNIDDLACIGAVDGFLVSNTIGRNAHRVDGAALAQIIGGYDDVIGRLRKNGINIVMTGGETADVGDLVRTVIVDSTVTVRLARTDVVNAARIRPGQVIVGLASFGKANYEDTWNSGIGSNGLTAARHLLFHPDYRTKYPETYSETIAENDVYVGSHHLTDPLADTGLTVGAAVLSPTRTYLPVIRSVLDAYRDGIGGIIHCTGGGQAKCRDFGSGLTYVKDNLFPTPAIFKAIRASGAVEQREMYQIFNMGHRMELYCDAAVADDIIALSESFGVEARVVGRVEAASGSENRVIIEDQGERYTFA